MTGVPWMRLTVAVMWSGVLCAALVLAVRFP
jgi:hypothetical protein